MSMPKKWRILNSYSNDISDSFCIEKHRLPTSSMNYSRCLHRSKSFTYNKQRNTTCLRRSSSLLSIVFRERADFSKKSFLAMKYKSKLNNKSTTEPIDLTDESHSMPTIVDIEENVELANQRQKIESKHSTITSKQQLPRTIPISDFESSTSSTINSHSTPHVSNCSTLTKSTIHQSISSSSYETAPYDVYHQESYQYRDRSQNIPSTFSVFHPYYYSTINSNNGNLYPHSFSSAVQYPMMKKSKVLPMTSYYNTHPSSVSLNHSPLPPASSASNNNNILSSVVMPIVRKPNYYHHLTSKQQTSPSTLGPCRLPCCFQPSPIQFSHTTEKLSLNERLIYRQYTVPTPLPQALKRDPSQTPDISNSSLSTDQKHRRIDYMPPTSTTPYLPYLSPKSCFIPPMPPFSSFSSQHWSFSTSNPNIKPSIRYPCPQLSNIPMNGMTGKADSYPQQRRSTSVQSRVPSATPTIAQNSSILISPPNTPHESTLPSIRTRCIDLQRAIIEHGHCDVDKLPKLVVRHTKTYSKKTVDTMGQLFPTWFHEPDYRCIHCFRCDQVFTPQQFMTHVDDEQMQHEQIINMTSIQLLTSEKMSEYKVEL